MSDGKDSSRISNATYEIYGRCIEKLLQDRHEGRHARIKEYAKREGIDIYQDQELTEVLAMTEILFDLERPRPDCQRTHNDDAATSFKPPKQNGHALKLKQNE